MVGRVSTAFRYGEVLRRGVPRDRVRQAVDRGRIVRWARGVYATGRERIDEVSAAVARLGGEAVVSHETAAELWGLPTLGRRPAAVQLTRTRAARGG